jgi:DNA helicase HerA-like ATPase
LRYYDDDKVIGFIVGETRPGLAVFLATRPPRLGEYVVIEHDEGSLLGMVEDSRAGNPYIPEGVTRLETVRKMKDIVGQESEYLRGKARILTNLESLLKRGGIDPPKTPPRTGNRVYEADPLILKKIFDPEELGSGSEAFYSERYGGFVRIGVLANHPEVPVYVKVDPLVTRHTAILAVTGQGKSNTVSIIADRIVNNLHATVLLFDMHSEYGGIGGKYYHRIIPKINPVELTLSELMQLMRITSKATNQQRILRQVYKITRENMKKDSSIRNRYIDYMIEILENAFETEETEKPGEKTGIVFNKKDRDAIYGVLNKLEDIKDLYSAVLDPKAPIKLESVVKPFHLNVVDLGEVDEKGSEVIVSYYARRLLHERKMYVRTGSEGYPSPILLILEEAHILVPREEETLPKTWIARIAREGRKFGIGVCLVSQRPKNIDENALSQTNNKIILKVVEPNDRLYIQRSSEQLSNELLELLPSLRQGEAIVLGEFTPIPALVKIDKHPGKTMGRDLKVTQLWLNHWKERTRETEEIEEFLDMIQG